MIKKLFIILSVLSSFIVPLQAVDTYPVIILGGGVGGLTSALYFSRAGIIPCVIEGSSPGGMIIQSHLVQNWPGEKGISGSDLIEKIKNQVMDNGCEFKQEDVVSVDFSKSPFLTYVKDFIDPNKIITYRATTCIIAMGTVSNKLNVEGEKDYWGKGVSNCAICDGSLYRDKIVAVIGGKDSSVDEALYLSNLAKKVFVVFRKDEIVCSDAHKMKTLIDKKNVEFISNSVVNEIKGNEDEVNLINIKNIKTNENRSLSVDGVFLAIGSKPNTQIFKGQIKLDENGYIIVNDNKETSIKGVFAIGDIVDSQYRQAITASAAGAMASINAQDYILDENKLNKAISKTIDENCSLVIEIETEQQFKDEISNSSIPVIVDFYATWCPPCMRLSGVLNEKAKSLTGRVKILKVNVDKFRKISSLYKIRAMPSIIIMLNGENLGKKVGTEEIMDFFNSLKKTNDFSKISLRECI